MLLKKDPKKMAALILIRKGEPKSYSEMKDENGKMNQKVKVEDEPSYDEGLVSAADDVIKAIGAKDAKMLAEALKSVYSMCDSMEDSTEVEE